MIDFRLQWFIKRIGKTVYRDEIDWCDCGSCKDGGIHGVFILDKDHAISLRDLEVEVGVKYRDEK